MVVRKTGWSPKPRSVTGAILHSSLSGGIQLGILQGRLAWCKPYCAAVGSLNRLDSYITEWTPGRSGRASHQNLRIVRKMPRRPIWITSLSDTKVLQLMQGMLLPRCQNTVSCSPKYWAHCLHFERTNFVTWWFFFFFLSLPCCRCLPVVLSSVIRQKCLTNSLAMFIS